MEYMVVYDSKTGNTEKIAMEIFETLPGKSKDIQSVTEVSGEAETYFVGFWNHKGTCSASVMELLSELHGKNIVLFGTSGDGSNKRYTDQLLKRVIAFIPDDNRFLGGFICAGKVPPKILNQCRFLSCENDTPQIRRMVKIYEDGMLHPDQKDLKNVRDFTLEILKKKEEIYGHR